MESFPILEQLVQYRKTKDQLSWARHAVNLLAEGSPADYEPSADGLIVRAGSEDDLEAAVECLERAYSRSITLGEVRVRCPSQAPTMEAWMSVSFRIPEQLIGAALGSLLTRRGKVLSIETSEGIERVTGEGPFQCLLGYARELSDLARQKVEVKMSFKSYVPAPPEPGPPRGTAAAKVA